MQIEQEENAFASGCWGTFSCEGVGHWSTSLVFWEQCDHEAAAESWAASVLPDPFL